MEKVFVKILTFAAVASLCIVGVLSAATAWSEEPAAKDYRIDSATLDAWAAPFRNWHHQPKLVIPAKPNIPGFPEFTNTDVPMVYQLPGSDKWYMSFIGFNGEGYQSFVAESDDLTDWKHLGLAFGFGPKDEFDYGGRVVGGFLYQSYDLKAPKIL